MIEIRVELLLGRKIYGDGGRSVGRIEEIRAEMRGDETVVTEYHVGSYAAIERLAAWPIGRAVLKVLGAKPGRGLRVPWDKLDLSDPERPRLKCQPEDLSQLHAGD